MDRLTTRIDGIAYGKSGIKRLSKDYHRGIFECTALVERLAEYEEAEEQGLLLRLPCKAGSDVFCISSRYTLCSEYEERRDECSCEGCEVMECDSVEEYYIKEQKKVSYFWIALNLEQFGKTIFLTREEAEQKLKEMEAKAK